MRSGFKGNKQRLPSKPCAGCGLPMSWSRKWAQCWEQVKYCIRAMPAAALSHGRTATNTGQPTQPRCTAGLPCHAAMWCTCCWSCDRKPVTRCTTRRNCWRCWPPCATLPAS
ncbi:DUF2256 domain-containing protein [Crenobacter oryzisoli]|uniref:DUF2256 domain-containing protein n=1 Tax=Crenobacter oryzisoli TaxID=3056844 RepID=UPI00338F6C4C